MIQTVLLVAAGLGMLWYIHRKLNESNRQTVDQNGNLREDDCEEDIGPHFEKHDAVLLYAKDDKPLVKHLQQVLMSNLATDIDDLNIVLYEEFVPEMQSYFKTTGEVFRRCIFLFVVVTSNFREDSLMRYQHEIALMDSIRNPSSKERVIPVWAEKGSQNILPELSVLRGIDYEGDQVDLQKFKTTLKYGRKNIHL